MKVLVTGAKGFIGKNLIATLNNIRTGKDKSFGISENMTIYEYDKDSAPALLEAYCSDCDFVFHLAGVNRPKEQSEYMEGNFGITSLLLELLKKQDNKCPVMLASSIQAELNNPYGVSKKAGEDIVFSYGKEAGVPIYVYRFPNVFGKWCLPNYNSVVATFCHNIAHGLDIQINNRDTIMNLVYIDDVVKELLAALKGDSHKNVDGYCNIPEVHKITLGEMADMLYSFKEGRTNLNIPDMTENSISKKLYATYLSYLPETEFSYPLKMNVDERGSFTEILRTEDRGQFSVNISKPGITKGNHWHHTKNEKFVVVSGQGLIQFRRLDSNEIIEYYVSGEKMEVVDIPTGYTHNIINLGTADLVTFMWCNECFNPEKPDTYFLPIEEKGN